MAYSGHDGAKIVKEAIIQFGKNLKSDVFHNAPFNKNVNGRIVGITAGGYTVQIQTKIYTNMLAINAGALKINDIVACCIPNNQMSQAYIVGRLVQNVVASSGGGGGGSGAVDDVQINGTSIVSNGVANLSVTTTATQGSNSFITSGGVYNAISNIAIPTSINGMSGGALTSPLNISGGSAVTASKIAIDHTQSGQITDEGTNTLFGFLSNGDTTLTVGTTTYVTNIRGSSTRPQYMGSDLALYSDIPTVPTKTSDLTNDGNGTLYEGESDPFATKSFVNSSIATNTAYFCGTFSDVPSLNAYTGAVTNNDYAFVINSVITDNGNDFATFSALDAYDKTLLTNFDYAWVINGSNFDLYRFDIVNQVWNLRVQNTDKASVTLNTAYNRYKATVSNNTVAWGYEYTLNNSSFTAAQWASINSGVTSNNWVSINSAQTISGAKTFSANLVLNNGIALKGKGGGGDYAERNLIGVASGGIGINLGDAASNIIVSTVSNGNFRPSVTNYTSLGTSSAVWKNLFLGGFIGSSSNSSYGLKLPSTSGWTANKTLATTEDIPTVNNPTITITQGGVTKGSFSLNQSTGDTIALDAGGGASSIDVQINGTSIVSNNVANIQTVGVYNASTNKIATASDLPTSVNNMTGGAITGATSVKGTLSVLNSSNQTALSIDQNGDVNGRYLKGTWLYTSAATDAPSWTDVYVNIAGWLYKRSRAGIKSDLGVPNDGVVEATASTNAKRDSSGKFNAVGFNLCTVSTSTANAQMQYNSTNESIEFIFN